MSTDQDWTNSWPTQMTFKQNAVPIPLRQGYIKSYCENNGLPPTKYGNTELMKIPNFLHLTPPHIKKQCQAIKSKFLQIKRLLKLENENFVLKNFVLNGLKNSKQMKIAKNIFQ